MANIVLLKNTRFVILYLVNYPESHFIAILSITVFWSIIIMFIISWL
jgi:hypothetical protein